MKDDSLENHPKLNGRYWKNYKNGRHYSALLTKNLFDDWIIIKVWGGSRSGQIRYCQYENFEIAVRELDKLGKYREKRGYKPVGKEK